MVIKEYTSTNLMIKGKWIAILLFIGTSFLLPVNAIHAMNEDAGHSQGKSSDRVKLTIDASEAEAVLEILTLRAEGKTIGEEQWQKVFATEPYRRLKQREEFTARYFHDKKKVFSDEDFKQFILSDDLLRKADKLRTTLEKWKHANLDGAAMALLGYLPDSSTIKAKIFPVIKPAKNSFVWEMSKDPAIFLYLDPEISPAIFSNIVAHELHHIGLSSNTASYRKKISSLDECARTVADWTGTFGEGMAMLAAAGGPEIHPHAVSVDSDRARWDRDMADFKTNFADVNTFFENILDEKYKNEDEINEKGSSFFGIQGPWYTVGYKMCVMVEKRFGRKALIRTMADPRQLLVLYNQTARERNKSEQDVLPLWSEHIIRALKVENN